MALSHRNIKTIECALLVVLALAACGNAGAKKSDRSQQIKVVADHPIATIGNNGKVILIGHVKISQGTLLIQGAKATGYENQNNQWDHAIVTGSPARFQQQLDSGSMVHGSADTIRYMVAENTVILTGHATVVQQGRGEFHGAKLTYNTDSGKIFGEGGAGGQVHMTFQPRSPAAKSAPTSAPASAASAAGAASSAPPPASGTQTLPVAGSSTTSTFQPMRAPASASASSAAPARASTTGTH